MPDRAASVWNDERLEKLTKFWEQGLSITQIGIRLGVTRNAVVGKVHRMGLPKRQSPIVRSCLLYTSPSPRDLARSRMPSSA